MRTHYLPRETIICNRPARVVLHGCEHASAVSCRKLTYQMQSLWLAIRCIKMRHGALKTRSRRNSIQPLMNQAICSTGCWTKTSRFVPGPENSPVPRVSAEQASWHGAHRIKVPALLITPVLQAQDWKPWEHAS